MKKSVKKLMAIIMSVIILFTLAIPAFAAGSSDEIVATISICSRVKEVPSLGHIWIYVHNISDRQLKVGVYDLPAGEGVSVGTFANTRADGTGVYYNIEAHCINKYSDYDFYSITKELTKSQLEALSSRIRNYNHWDFVFNCMYFAFTMYNEATGSSFASLIFPILGELQIKLYGGKYKALNMYYPSASEVYKQIGTGSSAYLTVVSKKSLETPIG